jgi:hypothetical protein
MTTKAKDEASPPSWEEGAPAVDSVKTKQRAEAALQRRDADKKAAQATASGSGETHPAGAGDSPKHHGDKLERSVREAASEPEDEPEVEDEP